MPLIIDELLLETEPEAPVDTGSENAIAAVPGPQAALAEALALLAERATRLAVD